MLAALMEAELSDAEEQLHVPAAIDPTLAPKPRALGVSARLGRGRAKGIQHSEETKLQIKSKF